MFVNDQIRIPGNPLVSIGLMDKVGPLMIHNIENLLLFHFLHGSSFLCVKLFRYGYVVQIPCFKHLQISFGLSKNDLYKHRKQDKLEFKVNTENW